MYPPMSGTVRPTEPKPPATTAAPDLPRTPAVPTCLFCRYRTARPGGVETAHA